MQLFDIIRVIGVAIINAILVRIRLVNSEEHSSQVGTVQWRLVNSEEHSSKVGTVQWRLVNSFGQNSIKSVYIKISSLLQYTVYNIKVYFHGTNLK